MLNIILLGITSLLTDASTEMVYPLIPLYLMTQLGAGPAVIGLIEGFAESLASLLKVFSGNFSDRIRRRKPLTIFGYSFSSIGKLILYVANAWGLVFLARVVDRVGKRIRTAPRDALIADSTPTQRLGMAYGFTPGNGYDWSGNWSVVCYYSREIEPQQLSRDYSHCPDISCFGNLFPVSDERKTGSN